MAKRVKPRDINSFIVFVDICDATNLSNSLSTTDYGNFILQFNQSAQAAFKAVIEPSFPGRLLNDSVEFTVRGDEVCLLIHGKHTPRLDDSEYDESRDFELAIRFVLLLYTNWILQPINIERIRREQLPLLLSVGVHYGPVYYSQFTKKKWSSEGYSINTAKRIESSSKVSNRLALCGVTDSDRVNTKVISIEPTHKLNLKSRLLRTNRRFS